jgi:hypothetical protein
LFHYVPTQHLIIIFPGTWRGSGLNTEPIQHVNYESAMVKMRDGRDKYREFSWNSDKCEDD